MAEKQQQAYQPPMSNGYNRADEEAGAAQKEELRRQKRKKWILYIIAFVIFQTAVIALFSMTVMKFRTPKFRIQSGTVNYHNFQTSNSPFNLTMNVTLGVKNTNFGPYKFDNTAIFFYDYQNTTVGSATVRKSKANFRSTKKLDVGAVNLAMPANSYSGSGILTLTGTAEMKGKVTIMFMFKKKKSTKLDCTMEVDIQTKELKTVKCK